MCSAAPCRRSTELAPTICTSQSWSRRLGPDTELILALNATVEGQTTAHYIADRAAATGARISRLAQGVPIGGELDYLDEGTLTAALKARRAL